LILSLNSIKRRDVVIAGACRTAIGDFRDSKRYKALQWRAKVLLKEPQFRPK